MSERGISKREMLMHVLMLWKHDINLRGLSKMLFANTSRINPNRAASNRKRIPFLQVIESNGKCDGDEFTISSGKSAHGMLYEISC